MARLGASFPRNRRVSVVGTGVYHADDVDSVISLLLGIRLSHLSVPLSLSVCLPSFLPAGSQPPGKADRLPPQVAGLLDGDQKLPRPPPDPRLLRPGAVRALQLHHGRPVRGGGARRGEMSAEGVAWNNPAPHITDPSPPKKKSTDLLSHTFLYGGGGGSLATLAVTPPPLFPAAIVFNHS